MAQRFAIDGNFTQSFVGTIGLNAQACPANVDNFASIFYDLESGVVCYVTASTDFCYEYVYGANDNNIPKSTQSEPIPRVQTYPKAKRFTFAAYDNVSNVPGFDHSIPTQDVTEAVFVMFDSESVNAGDLSNYLLQNASTGSLKLTTNTQAVEFDYTAQHVITGPNPNTTDQKKIILGNSNIDATASNPQFTLITKTSDEPFTNGETVCVEIMRQGGGGGTSTTYQTGSDVTQTDLTNLKIIDFDSNVFVTSDPVTGQLTLQFGTPALPVISSIDIPTTGNQGSDAFNTNRFSGPDLDGTPHNSLFVIDENYKINLTYTTASSNTFLSASILAEINGVETEILSSNTYNNGVAQTFNISNTSATHLKYFHSGSHSFKGAVNVILEDGTQTRVTTSFEEANINKSNPAAPNYDIATHNLIGGTTYVSPNLNDNDSNLLIEFGVTGSIGYQGSAASTSNGWTLIDVTGGQAMNITTTSTTDFVDIVANYTSSNKGTNALGNSTAQRTVDKNITRIASLRYAALPASVFTNYISPTENELLDILKWTNNGGVINFLTRTSTQVNGQTFNITWTGGKYHYIIMDNAISLSQINVDGFGSINAFTTGTTTNYRFYVTTGIQSGGTGTTAAYELIT